MGVRSDGWSLVHYCSTTLCAVSWKSFTHVSDWNEAAFHASEIVGREQKRTHTHAYIHTVAQYLDSLRQNVCDHYCLYCLYLSYFLPFKCLLFCLLTPIYLSICLSFFVLSLYMSVCLHAYLFPPIFLSAYIPISLSVILSSSLSLCLPFLNTEGRHIVFILICLSICQCACRPSSVSVFLSSCVSVCLSA